MLMLFVYRAVLHQLTILLFLLLILNLPLASFGMQFLLELTWY